MGGGVCSQQAQLVLEVEVIDILKVLGTELGALFVLPLPRYHGAGTCHDPVTAVLICIRKDAF